MGAWSKPVSKPKCVGVLSYKLELIILQPWKIVSKQTVLNHNKFLMVENHVVELPNGQVISDWPWVITPDYINVAAITEAGEFLCFRQIKYAVGHITLAPVGGYIEPGEDPLSAAKRELLEESGYEAPDWITLGVYAVDGNRGAGRGHLFLARNARQISEPKADDLEEQELLLLSREELEQALKTHQFKVLAWPALFGLALLYL